MNATQSFNLPVSRRTFDHEIRTPLAVVKGAAFLLKKECRTAVQREYISYISQAVDRLLSFANSLTDAPALPIPVPAHDDSKVKLSSSPYVLLVEDDLLVELVHKKSLKSLGCNVDVASSGEQAIEMSATNKYNVIFMDVGLPDISGIQATVTIRRYESLVIHTPIIGLTGYSDEQTQKECKAAGMDEVVIKPIELEKFKELLKQFC